MNDDQLINFIETKILCRLKQPPYGVGVFAIKNIPADTVLFEDEYVVVTNSFIPKETFSNSADGIKKMLNDFFPLKNGNYIINQHTLFVMNMNLRNYINHSKNCNVDIYSYRTLRNIEIGEEIFVDYTLLNYENDFNLI